MEGEKTKENTNTQAWDSASLLLDLSRFGVMDIRRKVDSDIKLPAASLLDHIFVRQQRQLMSAPFDPSLLQRLRAGAPPRTRLHVCLGTVRYRRRLRLEGPRQTEMAVQYELYLQHAVRSFMRPHVRGYRPDQSPGAQAARWVPPEERTKAQPHPFAVVPTLEALVQSVKSDVSPPVLHVIQCLVDWPALLGVRDTPIILNMPPAQANAADGHAMLVMVMSDLSAGYYFDPTGYCCIGSRYWRHRWEQALGVALQDLARTRRRRGGGEAWGPQVLPALLRQPNRELNVSSQWCYAWCVMVTGLLVWNCVQDAAGAEKIGAYLYAKRAKLQTLSIGEQAKYMDRKIRNFVLYMDEIERAPPVTADICSQSPAMRRRPPSVHPVADVYDNTEDGGDQFWQDLQQREFSPVLAAHAVDDQDQDDPQREEPAAIRASVDALTPPRKPRARRGAAVMPLEDTLNQLRLRGGAQPARGSRRH